MNTEQINKLKTKLEEEKTVLENDLKSVGHVNPENTGDWEATPVKQDIDGADENELGDKFETYEGNTAILKPLESRYNEVKKALGKITSGTGFGVCEVCQKTIESDRLEANPAASTCKEHMDVVTE